MSVDHIELLRWMATRERREGTCIDGTQLMVDASHLAGADLEAAAEVATLLCGEISAARFGES